MFQLIIQHWKRILVAIIVVDVLVVVGGSYLFFATDTFAGPPPVTLVPTLTPTMTPTPWAGPPKSRVTPTLIASMPTPLPTKILAHSGFPVGFTPTPIPTREPVFIRLPDLIFGLGSGIDAPSINQVLYPEPFFAAGTNNACGPVALYAGLLGLGHSVDYTRVRDVAVSYGFGPEGISKSGMINTIAVMNQELGYPFTIEHGNRYRTRDLIGHLGKGRVVVVLLRVRRVNGQYRVTTDLEGSIGHFLIVERINTRTRTVRFAGSTLGMEKVPLGDFVASWSRNPQAIAPPQGWSAYLKAEPATSWALILKPN